MTTQGIYHSTEGKVWRLDPFILIDVVQDAENDRWVVLGYTERALFEDRSPMRLDVAPDEGRARTLQSSVEGLMGLSR